jgi:hypothetical protein
MIIAWNEGIIRASHSCHSELVSGSRFWFLLDCSSVGIPACRQAGIADDGRPEKITRIGLLRWQIRKPFTMLFLTGGLIWIWGIWGHPYSYSIS